MKTLHIVKYSPPSTPACYTVPIPDRHEKWGYKTELSLNAFMKAQSYLKQQGCTYAVIMEDCHGKETNIPKFPCEDLWDFYQKTHWDASHRAFTGLGDRWN